MCKLAKIFTGRIVNSECFGKIFRNIAALYLMVHPYQKISIACSHMIYNINLQQKSLEKETIFLWNVQPMLPKKRKKYLLNLLEAHQIAVDINFKHNNRKLFTYVDRIYNSGLMRKNTCQYSHKFHAART